LAADRRGLGTGKIGGGAEIVVSPPLNPLPEGGDESLELSLTPKSFRGPISALVPKVRLVFVRSSVFLRKVEDFDAGNGNFDAPDRDSLAPDRDSVAPDRDSPAPDRDSLSPDRDSLTPDRDSLTPDRDSLALDRDSLAPDRDPPLPDCDSRDPDRYPQASDRELGKEEPGYGKSQASPRSGRLIVAQMNPSP
jgi:hypothetical protein